MIVKKLIFCECGHLETAHKNGFCKWCDCKRLRPQDQEGTER